MAQIHKLVGETKITSDANVFHDFFKPKSHQLSKKTYACQMKQGRDQCREATPTVGSVLAWNYSHEGKEKYAEEVIEKLDEEKKSLTCKVIEGDLMREYKSFLITLKVDTKGKENTISWTFEYEKHNESDPEPHSMLDLVRDLSKAIESAGSIHK